MKTIITTLALVFGLAQLAQAQYQADDIVGEYLTEDTEGKIKIYERDGLYYGKITYSQSNRKDEHNPDESLRGRSVVGVEFMTGFEWDEDDEEWDDGEVYNVRDGDTYSGYMWLEDGGKTLKMRGYVGISLFGKTATFTRL